MRAKWKLLAATALFALPVHGHQSEGVIPIFEIPDEMLEQIDLKDGAIDEWQEMFGEPTLTTVDFSLIPEFSSNSVLDPSDMDFRIWLGWTRRPSIYLAAIRADDIYFNEFSPDNPNHVMVNFDAISISIDADHTGGPTTAPGDDAVRRIAAVSNAQRYNAVSEVPEGGILESYTWNVGWLGRFGWQTQPPFADGGGGAAGENPNVSIMEFYVTPFDVLVTEAPEVRVEAELFPGKVIGLYIAVFDVDAEPDQGEVYEFPRSPAGLGYDADEFADALLLESEVTAVQADSWGRIKASLSQ